MYNCARRILEKRGLTIARSLVGSYVTSLRMARLLDPADTAQRRAFAALWTLTAIPAALRW